MKNLFKFKRFVFALGLAAALLAPAAAAAARLDIIENETGAEQPNPGDAAGYSYTLQPSGWLSFFSGGVGEIADSVQFTGTWDASGQADSAAQAAIAFLVDAAAPATASDSLVIQFGIANGIGTLSFGEFISHSAGTDLNALLGAVLPAGTGVVEHGLTSLTDHFYDYANFANDGNFVPLALPPGLEFNANSSVAIPEPETCSLLGAGLPGLLAARRRRKKGAGP